MNSLAIIIPAYKLSFFEQALDSIAAQTRKDFTVYIGDDNSPEDLYSVVKKYQEHLNIVYKKFESNVGSESVVDHWQRCVELTKGEEWIWLFSDDDVMSENCVDQLYRNIEGTDGHFDLYRFNCCIIDEVGNSVTGPSQYPTIQTASQFLISRLRYQYHSYIVNCVFSRRVYKKYNGFVNIKAAWGSDDATWILFGQEKNIYTLDKGLVKWRVSSLNISGNRKCHRNRLSKYHGAAQFVKWIYEWASQNNVSLDDKLIMNWYFTMLHLIGFRKRFWPYTTSKPFRQYFWRRESNYQLRMLKNDI